MEQPIKKIKRKYKRKKQRKPKSPTPPPPSPSPVPTLILPKEPVFNTILENELNEKMRYLKKRLYYTKDTDKKKMYLKHIDKLLSRPVIKL